MQFLHPLLPSKRKILKKLNSERRRKLGRKLGRKEKLGWQLLKLRKRKRGGRKRNYLPPDRRSLLLPLPKLHLLLLPHLPLLHHYPPLPFRLDPSQMAETTHSENLVKLPPHPLPVVDSTHSSNLPLLRLEPLRLFDLELPSLLPHPHLLRLLPYSLLLQSSALLPPLPPTMNGNESKRRPMIPMPTRVTTITLPLELNVLDSLLPCLEISLVQLDNRLLHPLLHLFQKLHLPLWPNSVEERLLLVVV